VEAFADAIGLGMSCLGLGVLDIVQSQIKQIIVCFRLAAILCTTVGQHTDHAHAMLLEEEQDMVIE